MQSAGSLFWAPASPPLRLSRPLLRCLISPTRRAALSQRVDTSRLVSTGTSTVTDWARTPVTVPQTPGAADHGTL